MSIVSSIWLPQFFSVCFLGLTGVSVGWNLDIVELEDWTNARIFILFSEEYRVSPLLGISSVFELAQE